MAKNRTAFVCYECGYVSSKWLGKCPSCSAWNTLVEEVVASPGTNHNLPMGNHAVPLDSISDQELYRFSSGIGEFDRVLGGGIVPGSLVLLGGDPGIGKSTLLLQVANFIADQGQKVLYLSGEESLKQIRLRSTRLGINTSRIYLLNEQNIDNLDQYIQEINPVLIIIDSIQTVYSQNVSSIPGSIAQLRECTARIMELAKKTDKAVILVGHVTKEGALAGPRVLEHMVDAVIYFEGEKNFSFRILRGIKNRFGSTDEIGLMEMSGQGLREVLDPSCVFLGNDNKKVSGVAIASSFEGTRPFLIEIQALVASSGSVYGRRMASGIDQNRLALIIAVLEKHRGYQLSQYDVFLKVTGGLFLKDPSIDLAIAAAVISSYKDLAISPDTVFIGELSLSGQIRGVSFMESRIKEVEKMGYRKVVVPAMNDRPMETKKDLEIIKIQTIDELNEVLMKG